MCLDPAAKAAIFHNPRKPRRHKTHKTLVLPLYIIFKTLLEGGIFNAKKEYSLLLLSNQRHIS